MKKKISIGLGVLVISLFAVLRLVPHMYYRMLLPPEASVKKSENLSNEFQSWTLPPDLKMAQDSQILNEEFKCSVCYPLQLGSNQCRDKITHFVAANLMANQEPADPSLKFKFKTYSLGNALNQMYSEATIYKLYLTFANQRMQTSDLDETCKAKFSNKLCSDLSQDESIQLELLFRAGANSDVVSDQVATQIKNVCIKPKKNG